MNKIQKIILAIGIIALIGTASAFLETRTLPNTLPLPDGRIVSSLQEVEYNFTNLSNSLSDSELNTLYYKIIVPEDTGDQWNLSIEFAESKPYRLLKPTGNPVVSRIVIVSTAQAEYAWVCCNITKGDRLYTTDATTNSSLRGTLTNMYDLNYKTRLFNYTDMSWENRNIGASKNPKVYNRRAALHQDGTQIAYAMETKNVSVTGVPELMKVFLI